MVLNQIRRGEQSERLALALRLAEAATREIRPRFRNTAVRTKSDGSEVTDADIAAEEAMRAILAAECPDEPVLGEEFGGDAVMAAPRAWVLDPIDGTQAFALGLPTFGVLIAYAELGEPLVGVIGFPALDRTIFAAKGLGCHSRDGAADAVPIRAASTTALKDAYASATSLLGSSALESGGYNLGAAAKGARRFRFVGDCLQHAMVCSGRLDAAIDLLAAPWDIGAIIPCVEEAGGVVASVRGERQGLLHAGSLISAATPALLGDVVRTLAPPA